MNAETWTKTRREFERLRELGTLERELWLSSSEQRDAHSVRELRALLAADEASDALLDSDAPSLQANWMQQRDAASALGSVVDEHELVEVIGEGGSATVYRAQGAGNVAVKVLKHESCSPGLSRRFEQEREALAGLDHPGLIRVLGAGHLDDGRPYLVTEFVLGQPIDAHCERGALDLCARLRLMVLVCRAVHAAHARLVVHRDLKPSNILVGADGQPKVLDFGVAKLLDPARDPLWTDLYGRGPLTPAYASPEQIRGERITTAADIYSLGVVLHELVTGASPYRVTANDREALERAVLGALRRTPQDAARESGRPQPPADVVLILERALAAGASERYASAEHLAQDLECFLEGRPLLSRNLPWKQRAARFVRRHPWSTCAGAALALILLGSWLGTERSLRRVVEGERLAWRAHASAVQATHLLADLLQGLGASGNNALELDRLAGDAEAGIADLAQHPETEARLRMALARLRRALGGFDQADAHWERALELSRNTSGLSWNDTDRCLEQLCELRAERGDARSLELARERVELLARRDEPQRSAQASQVLESLQARFGAR